MRDVWSLCDAGPREIKKAQVWKIENTDSSLVGYIASPDVKVLQVRQCLRRKKNWESEKHKK